MRYGRERKLPEGVLVEFFRCPAGAGRAEREPGNGQLACRLMENGRRLGQRRPANIRLSPGVPRRLRPNPSLCHSERSEESFPLRTKGRLRTMPRKEEKDKRSAVKNLFGARLQMFRCARHDICGRSLQRGKRQTKCNQESIRVRLQILRRYPLLRMTTLVVPIVAPRMTE